MFPFAYPKASLQIRRRHGRQLGESQMLPLNRPAMEAFKWHLGPGSCDGHDDDGRQYQKEVSGASLHAEEPSEFRALAAWANYLAQDRPDIQYAVKEVARRMSVPTDTRPAQTSGTILGAGLLEVFCTTAGKASQTRSKSSQTRTGQAARPRRGVQAEEWHEQAGIHERRGVLRRR